MSPYFSTLFQKKSGKKRQRHGGFSLIEMLIVVAIFLLLLILASQQLGTQMAKGRDARRKADLDKIKKVFEDYASDRNQYPPFGTLDNCGDPSATALAGYINEIPCDPRGNPYLYVPYPDFSDTSGGFRVYAQLEIEEDPDIKILGCNFGIGCGIPVTLVATNPESYNYGVSEGVPVYFTGDAGQIPTEGICCPVGNSACNITTLVNGACPGNPPYAPFPDNQSCIENSPCTEQMNL